MTIRTLDDEALELELSIVREHLILTMHQTRQTTGRGHLTAAARGKVLALHQRVVALGRMAADDLDEVGVRRARGWIRAVDASQHALARETEGDSHDPVARVG